MEIYLKKFKRKFEVKSSNRNLRETYKLQLAMARMEDLDNKSPEEQVQNALDLTDSLVNYLVKLLKLSDEDKDLVEDLTTEETMAIVNRLTAKLLGIKEDDSETKKKGKPQPKSLRIRKSN